MTKKIANRDKLISEVVRLRKSGMLLSEIGKRLGLDRETTRYLFRLRVPRALQMAKPVGAVPQRTLGGVLWNWPPIKPSRAGGNKEEGVCEACALIEQCNAHVHGSPNGFIGCERPLAREMMDTAQARTPLTCW